jgi:hypothetical protein
MILACGFCGGMESALVLGIVSSAWIATDIYNRVQLCRMVRASGARQGVSQNADGTHCGVHTDSTVDSDCDEVPIVGSV